MKITATTTTVVPTWREYSVPPDGLEAFWKVLLLTWGSIDSAHHFWSEPWDPNRFQVRVKAMAATHDVIAARVTRQDGVTSKPWDAGPDEELYGRRWEQVAAFFCLSSQLADDDERLHGKLVHCFLNARGYSTRREARFHLRRAWFCATLPLRIRLWRAQGKWPW